MPPSFHLNIEKAAPRPFNAPPGCSSFFLVVYNLFNLICRQFSRIGYGNHAALNLSGNVLNVGDILLTNALCKVIVEHDTYGVVLKAVSYGRSERYLGRIFHIVGADFK